MSKRPGGGNILVGWAIFTAIVGAAVAVDLWSKAKFFSFADCATGIPSREVVRDFFYISSASNRGAVIGILENQTFLLAALSVLALIIVGVILVRLKGRSIALYCALGLIVGGALGNMYDRVLLQTPSGESAHFVRDFLLFKIFGWYYPTFNAADAFICVGAFAVAIKVLLDGRKKDGPDPGLSK